MLPVEKSKIQVRRAREAHGYLANESMYCWKIAGYGSLRKTFESREHKSQGRKPARAGSGFH